MRLEFQHIFKSFSGTPILKDVTFQAQSGKAMGFLGRNGAGKTTTIRTLMNVFPPDSGQFILDGKTIDRRNTKIGYLPEERGMYQNVPIIDQLIYFGELKQMSRKDAKEAGMRWLKYLELEDWARKKLETLSKGNQQKVQITQAVLNDPDILILDEPFSGLDPVNAQVLKELIHNFIAKDRIVLFSSHQMGYVEEFCDDITFIQDGRIILSSDLNEIKRETGKGKLRIKVNNLSDAELSGKLSTITDILITNDRKSLIVSLLNGKTHHTFLKEIMDMGLPIELFSYYEPSLEDIFIQLEEDKNPEEPVAQMEGASK